MFLHSWSIRRSHCFTSLTLVALLSACGGADSNVNASQQARNDQQLNSAATVTASLSLATASPALGSKVTATLQLQNAKSMAVQNGEVTLNLPAGFVASNPVLATTNCAGNVSVATGKLSWNNVSIPAKDNCTLNFTLALPTLALAAGYQPAFGFSALQNVVGGSTPKISFAANTPPPAPASGAIGSTPGELTWWNMPSSTQALSEMDFYITPSTDPGPNSDIYWSNEFDGLSGYSGMQTTFLSNPQTGQTGKLFLFSIWGATSYKTGTSPGSWCQFGTDGASGWSCRYVYNWQVDHTYRFRLSALGSGWYKVNVTDMSGTDSFDIGSLQIDVTQLPAAINSIPASGGLSQWVENFDWNDPRTSCLDTPYSNVTETMTAIDASSGALVQPSFSQVANPSQPNVCSNQAGGNVGNNMSLTSGIGDSARGLFKNGKGNCINAEGGLGEGANAILYACPTVADSAADSNSNSPIDGSLWVLAQDGSIRAKSDYCLTIGDDIGASGAKVTVESCIAGALNQQWTVSNQTIVSKLSGACLNPASIGTTPGGNTALSMTSCSATDRWVVPGKSFTY